MTMVLVVDDEFLITEVLALALEEEGYEVRQAGNGRVALEIMAEQAPELVITDFMMPVMNGRDLAKAIRGQSRTAKIPVMLMTGAHAHMAREHGDLFDHVLTKPFDMAELTAVVKGLIDTSRHSA
ncbi:response regulator [Pseudomonas sp. MAG002Y]|uniref:response regulator n=1 Tax=Pseudomonas sp. MAG002Y TaxID=2678690 RepID=UPI001C60C6F1|nr:response regulator [Pseudomonas sp. MAG002Y]MBW5416339.1 response regulator [Pseudomonas sp. MAG002Y]